jgi:hypothetical protein
MLSDHDLIALCEKWQKILHIQDWQVKPRLARYYDMPDGKGGHISFSRPHRTASIKILDPADYDPTWTNFPEDIERSLVHELIHLVFAVFDQHFGDDLIRLEEIAINSLERSLIEMDRR